jgi:RHS repeat-associated protein
VNATTNEVKRYSYNAWGIPRDADDWDSEYTGELFAGRGFTRHEHLTEFNLINMNGRIFDPVTGRFLSPDSFVQLPNYPNSYNRYSYALNNPLRFIDPSGYTYSKPSDWEREQRDGKHTYYNYSASKWWRLANPQLTGSYSTNYSPGSGYGSVEAGTHFDWKTGKTYKVYMNTATGRMYYDKATGSKTWWEDGEIYVAPTWDRVYVDNPEVDFASNGGDNDKNAHVASVSNGSAAFIVGAMYDIGIIVDSYGNASNYLTIGYGLGFGASAGVGYTMLPKGTRLGDFQGGGSGLLFNTRIPYVSGEIISDEKNGVVGENFVGGGGNIGAGKTFMLYFSHTFLFTVPEDFWSRPGSRR